MNLEQYSRMAKSEDWHVEKSETSSDFTIQHTLLERGNRYGPFKGHAWITQKLKDDMREHKGWILLNGSQKEALEMIAHKIGRILNGDPNYDDSWVDIAGYAQLVVNQLRGDTST